MGAVGEYCRGDNVPAPLLRLGHKGDGGPAWFCSANHLLRANVLSLLPQVVLQPYFHKCKLIIALLGGA